MCMTSRIRTLKRPKKGEFLAWKSFFRGNDGKLMYVFRPLRGESEVKVGEWLTCERTLVCGIGKAADSYSTGFHVYPRKPSTYFGNVLRRVRVRGVRVTGYQNGERVWVADEMYVLRSGKRTRRTA